MTDTDDKTPHAEHMKHWRNKNPQLSVCLTFAEYVSLGRIAKAKGTSLAGLTRTILKEVIAAHETPRHAGPVPPRDSPMCISSAVVMPQHLPTKTVSTAAVLPKLAPAKTPVEQAMADISRGLTSAEREVLRAPVPAVPPKQLHFYHPESDSYVSIPETEVEAFRSSMDGALCMEVERLPPELEAEGLLPNCYAPAPKKEAVKPTPRWSYKDYLAKQAK